MATDFTSQITAWYQAVQYRTPPAADLAVYNASLNSGALTTAQVQGSIINDPYTVNFVNPIIREYQAAFGRVPDQAGVNFWATGLAAGTQTLTTLGTTFANSAEFTARFGATATTIATPSVVTALYTNVLGRSPDAAGLAFWQASGLTAAQLLNAFAGSAEFVTAAAGAVTAFQNLEIAGTPPTTGSLFLLGGTQNAGSTFTLTTAIDTVVGTAGNDTIVGVINAVAAPITTTANAGDSVDGGAGVDTFRVIDTVGGATQLAGVTVKNVENLSVQLTANATAVYNVDGVGYNTVTALNTLSTTAANAVVFNNLATGASVIGSGSSTAAGAVVQFTYKTASDAVTVGFDGGVKGETIAATAGTATTGTITSTGAANGATQGSASSDTVKLAAGATITTLNVNAATNLGVTLTVGDFAVAGAALTVTGNAASVDLGNNGVFKSVNASALAGGLTVTTGALLTSLTGGQGADTITLGAAPAANATINLGAGNDTLLGAVALPSAAVVDGGAGIDAISAALVNVGSAGNVKNFELLDASGFNSALDAALLTASTITGVQFSGGVAAGANIATLQNVANVATLSSIGAIDQATVGAGNLGQLVLTQAGTNPTLAVTFNSAPTVAAAAKWFDALGNVTITGETALSIASTGNSFTAGNGIVGISQTDNKLATITITGDKDFTLGGVLENISGTIAANTAAALATIDGSAATGKLSITAGADQVLGGFKMTYNGLTINGGSGADTIVMNAKNGIVNAGGGADKITVNFPGVASAQTDVVTVNGGAGNDALTSNLTYQAVGGAATANTNGNFVFFADAATGDSLVFGTVANATGTFGAKANVGAAATFDQAVFLAENAAANTVSWFQYAGNTYVENSGAAAGTADNIVIKLTGIVDLTNAAIVTGAAGTVTFA